MTAPATKLLLDENLSRRLLPPLKDLFPGSSHVAFEGLLHAAGEVVFQHARAYGYCLLSADPGSDELDAIFSPPPKVIWLRGCPYPTAEAESILRTYVTQIAEFLADPARSVLILTSQ